MYLAMFNEHGSYQQLCIQYYMYKKVYRVSFIQNVETATHVHVYAKPILQYLQCVSEMLYYSNSICTQETYQKKNEKKPQKQGHHLANAKAVNLFL